MGRGSRKRSSAAERGVHIPRKKLYHLGITEATHPPRMQRSIRYLAFAVSLTTFLLYMRSLQNGFLDWDDNIYVFDNPYIRSFNLSLLRWAFSSFYASNWHPLAWVSHATDYAIWGLNPLGHHLTNVILNAANTFVVVILVARLIEAWHYTETGSETALFQQKRKILVAAGITGLLFGLHPVHVESVAWISERKDLLCALFFLLSIKNYTRYATFDNAVIREGKWAARFFNRYYLFTLGFFVLALLSKPMAVSLPGVLLLLDSYPFRRILSVKSFLSVVTEKLPFILLSLISSIMTILAQQAGEAIQSLDAVSASSRLLVAAESLLAYLGKMILPIHLIPYYPYPGDVSLISLKYLTILLIIILFTAVCITTARRQAIICSCLSYYVLTLVPVIGIVRVGSQSMADRYTYLPSIGPFLIIGLAVAWLFKFTNSSEGRGRISRMALVAILLFVFTSLTYLTVRQIDIWRNSLTFWNYVIDKEPTVAFAHNNRGWDFASLGRFDEAIEDLNKAIALKPKYFEAYNTRGVIFVMLGHYEDAIEDFDRAIALKPSCYEAYAARGVSYRNIGRFPKAIESFNQAIAIHPDRAEAYNDRGLTYAFAKQYQSALQDYNIAIELYPTFAIARDNRGDLYRAMGENEQAIVDYQQACNLGDKNGCIALRNMTSN